MINDKQPAHADYGTGYRLFKAMKENDYGVIKLSEETGIAKQTIRRLLRGNSTGNLHTWGVIANKLNISIDWIYHNGE